VTVMAEIYKKKKGFFQMNAVLFQHSIHQRMRISIKYIK